MRTPALLLILTLVACGDDKASSATDETTATSSATDATDATTATTATSSATDATDATTATSSATDATDATSATTTTTMTTGETGSGAGEPSQYTEACAPTDGPAVEFSIGVAARECTADFADDAPILRITLYQGVDLPLGAHVLDGFKGFATYDIGDGMPKNANVGTVTIDAKVADGLTGTYDLTFSDDSHLSGSFDAIYCPRDVLCG